MIGKMSLEKKLKNLIAGVIRLNKLKSLMIPAKSPGFIQFMFWMLGITTMVFFLWLFEFIVAKKEETVSPKPVQFELSPYFPPPSKLSSPMLMFCLKFSIVNQKP